MKSAYLFVILGLFLYALNMKAACIKANILEDISLPGQKSAEGYYNLMEIEEGIDALCSKGTLRGGLFRDAFIRLDHQVELIDILFRAGELKPNGVRYYSGFFKDVRDNLIACESEAKALRSGSSTIPKLKKLVRLTIRPNELIDIYYLSQEGGVPRKHIVSHKIWFGRIIRQDGFDLCQTQI